MIVDTDIIKKAAEHVEGVISKIDIDEELYSYHGLKHVQGVVEAAEEVGKGSNLDQKSMEVVLLSAWFHDVGYYNDHERHEEASIIKAADFLEKEGISSDVIERVAACIRATKMPQSPQSLEAMVLCDADLYHLSSPAYFEWCGLMKNEFEKLWGKEYSDSEWVRENIKFFESHTYFTDYCKEKLAAGKEENYQKVKEEYKKHKKGKKFIGELEKSLSKLEAKLDKQGELRPDRGRETLFRLTSRNHLELSGMADNKANIMISINSIILSLVVSILIRKFEESPYLIIPTLILTAVCLTTIIFSILATRPNVSRGKFSRNDIIRKRTNLLFFGNFHGMPLEDYEWGMKEMLKDGEYIYSSLIRDIYFLGVVLGKKYRLLRISYTVFMFGIVIAVFSFVFSITLG